MRSSVTVTGPPRSIWRRKIGTTLPEEPSTLPKRTALKRVSGKRASAASRANSASALDAPITVAGRDRLVGRDQHEALHARLAGDVRYDLRADRVVAHRLDRVGLHQADVLVRGRVEDDRRAVLGEHLAHALLLLAVGEHRGEHRRRHVALVLELALDREEVVLGVIEQHDPVGLDARDLAAQLRADRAAGAGHEHRLARQVGADALELHVHGLAAEHVLDAHLAHLPGERAARLQQLEHGRQRAHGDRARAALAHDARARASRARRGSR